MKVIDLLNKIANGEEVPKYVQYYNMLKDKTDIMMICKENIFYKLDQLEIQLNSRIEPLEEEHKIPEKLDTWFSMENVQNNGMSKEDFIIKYANYNFETYFNKINEIINYLEEIK